MLPCSCRCGKGSDNSRDLQLRRCGQPHGQSDRRSSGTAANAGHCPILIGDASEIILLRIFRKCQEADRRESGNNRKSDCRDSRNNAGQGGDSGSHAVRKEGGQAMMRRVSEKRIRAFSLPEMLVVLVIIGILVLIALPNLMPLISKAKSMEAQQQLAFVHTLQKSYFYTYSRYCDNLEELGFEQQPLVTDGGNANYRIEIVEAGDSGFKAQAVSVVDFDKDGQFNVWEIDQDKKLKEIVKD